MTQPRNLGAFADNLNTSGQVSLTTGVSGTLPVANGGTGQTSLSSVSVGSATSATTATNLASGSAGVIPYQTGSGATSFTAAGTSGQVLTSAGTGTPTWSTPSAGAMTLISTQTASNSSTISFTGLSGYDKYLVILTNVVASTGGQSLNAIFGTGSSPTYVTSGYYSQGAAQDSSNAPNRIYSLNFSSLLLGGYYGVYTSGGLNGYAYVMGMTSNGLVSLISNSSYAVSSTIYAWDSVSSILVGNTTSKTAIQFFMASGNIASGTISLYGITS